MNPDQNQNQNQNKRNDTFTEPKLIYVIQNYTQKFVLTHFGYNETNFSFSISWKLPAMMGATVLATP